MSTRRSASPRSVRASVCNTTRSAARRTCRASRSRCVRCRHVSAWCAGWIHSWVSPMGNGYNIGVVGATGQVGREFLRILEEGDRPDLPINRLRLFASQRSAGNRVSVRGQEHLIEEARPDPRLFEGLDFVVTAIGDEHAKMYSPAIAKAGALNVDKSNAWRMDPAVPLVVPEGNPEA